MNKLMALFILLNAIDVITTIPHIREDANPIVRQMNATQLILSKGVLILGTFGAEKLIRTKYPEYHNLFQYFLGGMNIVLGATAINNILYISTR